MHALTFQKGDGPCTDFVDKNEIVARATIEVARCYQKSMRRTNYL
jgi:hypothetical protein